MPKRPDPSFPIPGPEKAESYVLDLLGGIVRRRPLTGEEALAQLNRIEEDARRGHPPHRPNRPSSALGRA